ncbi:MAG: hypothetical protein IPP15_05475 [Saprospiraceae bacterium]|uniref:NIPSNAP family containing protein n=1 Tax=Candidatus Opimibacter skivensis TaxID=2982028 RepID=A0A9D7XM55_9BACT|nr:hypothetical protein [Candidatus Opimibacter skivensis]
MKKLLFILLLSPILGFAQTPEYLMFEITSLKVSPDKAAQVETAMGAHNKKYHATGQYGVRVYTVGNGPNSGDYKWVMGPGPWSGLDARPDDPLHNLDWDGNVARNLVSATTEYIQFDPKLSRFPSDFNVNKLFVRYIDVARGKMDKVKELLDKVHKVYMDKIPGETYGVYFNEMPSTSSGRDITIVSFFDKYAWMSKDDGFDAKYDEVYGKGSSAAFWTDWMANTVGLETELWEYKADLSGLPAAVKAADRQ